MGGLTIPIEFRRQVVHLWLDTIGAWGVGAFGEWSPSNNVWQFIHKALAREYGLLDLASGNNEFVKMQNFFLNTTEVTKVLDAIELTFRLMSSNYPRENGLYNLQPKPAIEELNLRFEEHALGYEFLSNEIIRKDSKFIHSEITKKSLEILHENGFEGASDEFLNAHKHYREGKYKEAMNDALKAFESTMKIICVKKKWTYSDSDTAKKLIQIMFDNELIPKSQETYFAGLRTTLEAGLPTMRNKNSGHGQGETVVAIPRSVAHYALNLAATNIVFLVESFKN